MMTMMLEVVIRVMTMSAVVMKMTTTMMIDLVIGVMTEMTIMMMMEMVSGRMAVIMMMEMVIGMMTVMKVTDDCCDHQGGQYVLTLCDWYVASISVMFLAIAETLVLGWVYGT